MEKTKTKTTSNTQCGRIKEYMERNGKITALEALVELGVFRLASRICDLRKQGVKIADRWREVDNRYGEKCRIKEYYLEV